MHKAFLFFLQFLVYTTVAYGQYYDSGQDPNRIRWKQFNSERFQLIYPEGLDSLATIYFSNLENIQRQESGSLTFKPKKIPVILHNQTIISNGEVGWAPKRMNLYLVAGQDNYFQPWHQHLLIHEYRHTAQISLLNQGSTKFLNVIFGEQASAAILGWHIPLWFVEGDAVAFETGATKAGRGRVPDFSMKIKAQINEKGTYSYPKAMFGSFKDFVPNRYELGYQLVSAARETYGPEIWNHALETVAKKPIRINPFSTGIKDITGLSERKLYFQIMEKLKNPENNNISEVKGQKVSELLFAKNDYVNYYSPVKYQNKILAYKTSYKHISGFYLIDSVGNENKIIAPGYVFDNTFSSKGNMLIWNELKSTRWENETFSRITVYEFSKNKTRYLLEKGKAFHSRISSDNSHIVSVEMDEKIHWSITIRNSIDGSLIKSFPFDTLQPVQPDWSFDDRKIVFIGISNYGKSLGILDLNSESIEWILKDELLEISHPKLISTGIWVKGTYNNASNYYFYSFDTQQWNLATNESYGVGEGNDIDDKFYYTNYTAEGYKIKYFESKQIDKSNKIKPQKYESETINKLAAQENQIDFEKQIPNSQSIDYKKITHLFNFHSWAPLAIRVENQEIGWGVSAMSQNALSTSFLTLGYQYHAADAYHEFFLNYQYKGFYPIIDNKYSLIPFSFEYPDKDSIMRPISGIQQQLAQNWLVPFYFNKGPWYRLLQPEFGYTFTSNYYNPSDYFIQNDIYQHKFAYRLNGYNLLKQSYRDLYSKWGQSWYLQYEHVPFDDRKGQLIAASGRFYFPGIFANHSYRMYGGYQFKEGGDIPFYGKLLYPRGYLAPKNDVMVTTRFEYALPLMYPDLNLIELIYLKRIRLNMFYDYAQYQFDNDEFNQQSTGIEMGFDFHLIRFVAPIDVMLRYAYKINEHEPFVEFKFSVDFNALYNK